MQAEATAKRGASGRTGASLYLMSWVAVAAFGLGYIGVAATRPDLLGAILPLAEPAQDQANASRQGNDLAEEMSRLRRWVHELQHELAATKSTLQEQVAHSSSIVQRLTAAEEKLGALREVRDPVIKTVPVPRGQTKAQAPTPPAPAAAEPARVAEAAPAEQTPANTAGVRVLNGASSPIATGSVPDTSASAQRQVAAAAPPPTPAFSAPKVVTPAPPPAPPTPRGIEIGNAESLDALRARWGELSGRNPDALGALAPRYRLAGDGRASPFTLLAGPFDNTTDATRACNSLKARGIPCRVSGYGGNAF